MEVPLDVALIFFRQFLHGRIQNEFVDGVQVLERVFQSARSRSSTGENTTTGGLAPNALKKLKGARFTRPSPSTVVTQAIRSGRHDADQGPIDRHDIRTVYVDNHSIDPTHGIGRVVQFDGVAGQLKRLESIDHHGQLVRRAISCWLATIVPGCGSAGSAAAGMKRRMGSLLDTRACCPKWPLT